jgi:membrane associated rhomboid family serine protease
MARTFCRLQPKRKRVIENHDFESDRLLVRDWDVPYHAHSIPLLMVGLMGWICCAGWPASNPGTWLLSSDQLETGHLLVAASYMFAHISWVHWAINCLALLALGGPLVASLGSPSLSWLRFTYLYLGSGIAGGLLFVAFNQNSTPLLGASGAIFGVLGALARVHPATQSAVPVGSRRTWLLTKLFLGNHALLFLIVGVVAVLTGQVQSLAWEAHLGGMLFGFFAAPLFLESE